MLDPIEHHSLALNSLNRTEDDGLHWIASISIQLHWIALNCIELHELHWIALKRCDEPRRGTDIGIALNCIELH